MMMMGKKITTLVWLCLLSLVTAQQQYDSGYYDQDQDNLYHDYAARQQEKDQVPG